MAVNALVQSLGALLILAPFALAQFHVLGTHSWPYLVPNALGSAILRRSAVADAQWGLILLDGIWAVVSLWGLGVLLRGKAATVLSHG